MFIAKAQNAGFVLCVPEQVKRNNSGERVYIKRERKGEGKGGKFFLGGYIF